jgi:hypothetical protein
MSITDLHAWLKQHYDVLPNGAGLNHLNQEDLLLIAHVLDTVEDKGRWPERIAFALKDLGVGEEECV